MKLLLSLIASSSSLGFIPSIIDENVNVQNITKDALIDIRDKLPGGDLGKFTTVDAAKGRMFSVIAETGYKVTIDDSRDELFILEGIEEAGYTGFSVYTYTLTLTNIKDKLPGGNLGYFTNKIDARKELDSLIYATDYYVKVDDTFDDYFIVSGIEEAGYTGTSIYTWSLSLVNIKNILGEDKNIGRFLDINAALNYSYLKIIATHLSLIDVNVNVERINDKNGYIVISGKPEKGFTGTIKWKTGTFLKDIYLILINESPFLPVENVREATVIVNEILKKYGLYGDVNLIQLGSNALQVKWKKISLKYTGFKTFYWN